MDSGIPQIPENPERIFEKVGSDLLRGKMPIALMVTMLDLIFAGDPSLTPVHSFPTQGCMFMSPDELTPCRLFSGVAQSSRSHTLSGQA